MSRTGSHDSPLRLLLGERRSDFLNKSITNRVKPFVSAAKLLSRRVFPSAFGNVHCRVDLQIHQDDQSIGVPLAARIRKYSADVTAGPGQAKIMEQSVRNRFRAFV